MVPLVVDVSEVDLSTFPYSMTIKSHDMKDKAAWNLDIPNAAIKFSIQVLRRSGGHDRGSAAYIKL